MPAISRTREQRGGGRKRREGGREREREREQEEQTERGREGEGARESNDCWPDGQRGWRGTSMARLSMASSMFPGSSTSLSISDTSSPAHLHAIEDTTRQERVTFTMKCVET
jgi:hypothetical protein